MQNYNSYRNEYGIQGVSALAEAIKKKTDMNYLHLNFSRM